MKHLVTVVLDTETINVNQFEHLSYACEDLFEMKSIERREMTVDDTGKTTTVVWACDDPRDTLLILRVIMNGGINFEVKCQKIED
jgi:hypothetical protein